MKVLHYSDRGAADFLRLYRECEVMFCTGDLTQFDFAGLAEEQVKKPMFGVYGNHDSGRYLEELGIENVHKRVISWNGLKIGGFQSCLKYKESGLMFTEEEAQEFTQTFPYVDILLLHAGPKDMLDEASDEIHAGSESIRRYVLEKRPRFVFCGHQYSDAFMQVGETKMYRTYGARMFEVVVE